MEAGPPAEHPLANSTTLALRAFFPDSTPFAAAAARLAANEAIPSEGGLIRG